MDVWKITWFGDYGNLILSSLTATQAVQGLALLSRGARSCGAPLTVRSRGRHPPGQGDYKEADGPGIVSFLQGWGARVECFRL